MSEKKQETQNVNLVISNTEEQKDEVIISLFTLFRKLRRYFLAWFLTAVIIGGMVAGVSVFFSTTSSSPVRAVVSFTYDGIEKGKFPDGSDFEAESLKSPTVLQEALEGCGIDASLTESVRHGLMIEGLIPEETYNRLTALRSVFDRTTSGHMQAAQQIIETNIYSTQYEITFNYKRTGMKRNEAVQVLNTALDCYKRYFFKRFGYNEPLGSSIAVINYMDYDYAQAVDIYSDNLTTLRRYVNSLATGDTTRFRSTETGLTFADLRDAIDSVTQLDLDRVSSFVTVNNCVKDKDETKAYYQYRIDALTRSKTEYQELLDTLNESIENYEKDQILIFGQGDGTNNTTSTIASEQYDKLIAQKVQAQTDLSHTTQQIVFYNQRLDALRRVTIGDKDKNTQAEERLAQLDKKVKELSEVVKKTADDYYENVSLSSAYSILVPASSDTVATVTSGISKATTPLIGSELLLAIAYLAIAFVSAIIEDRKKHLAEAAAEEEKTEKADKQKEK